MAVGIAFFEHEVTALNKANIDKPLPHTTQCLSIGTFRSDPEIAKPYPLIRLRNRHTKWCGLRPCCSDAAEQRDKLAASHSITSSARSRNDSGIVRPSAFAVVRLTTRSYLVGCSTGRSPGFAPSRILCT